MCAGKPARRHTQTLSSCEYRIHFFNKKKQHRGRERESGSLIMTAEQTTDLSHLLLVTAFNHLSPTRKIISALRQTCKHWLGALGESQCTGLFHCGYPRCDCVSGLPRKKQRREQPDVLTMDLSHSYLPDPKLVLDRLSKHPWVREGYEIGDLIVACTPLFTIYNKKLEPGTQIDLMVHRLFLDKLPATLEQLKIIPQWAIKKQVPGGLSQPETRSMIGLFYVYTRTEIFNCGILDSNCCDMSSLKKQLPNQLSVLELPGLHLDNVLTLKGFPENLRILNLNFNRFHGSLNLEEVSSTSLLEELYLEGNELSEKLQLETLPANLRILDLRRNFFHGGLSLHESLPVRLEELYLDNNMLCGQLQTRHRSYQSLQVLSLAENKFNGYVHVDMLPRNLTALNLAHNDFGGPFYFCDLPKKMRRLNLAANNFEGEIDMTKLPPNLTFLNVEMNRFSGRIDLHKGESPGGACSSLRELYIGDNLFTYVPSREDFPPLMQLIDYGYFRITKQDIELIS